MAKQLDYEDQPDEDDIEGQTLVLLGFLGGQLGRRGQELQKINLLVGGKEHNLLIWCSHSILFI